MVTHLYNIDVFLTTDSCTGDLSSTLRQVTSFSIDSRNFVLPVEADEWPMDGSCFYVVRSIFVHWRADLSELEDGEVTLRICLTATRPPATIIDWRIKDLAYYIFSQTPKPMKQATLYNARSQVVKDRIKESELIKCKRIWS